MFIVRSSPWLLTSFVFLAACADQERFSAEIAQPMPAAVVRGEVTIIADVTSTVASVKEVASVDFSVDGTVIGTVTESTDSPTPNTKEFVFKWDSKAVQDGEHFLSVRAFDAAGATLSKPSLTVTVVVRNKGNQPNTQDPLPPTVVITRPADNTRVNQGDTVNIEVTAAVNSKSTNRTIKRVEFLIDGALAHSATTAPYAHAWSTAGAPSGAHSIVVKAVDSADKTAEASITLNVDVVAQAGDPTVSLTEPANNSTYSQGDVVTLRATAEASESRAITQVAFYANNGLIAVDSTPPFEADWNTLNAVAGTNILKAVALDDTNRTGEASVSVTVNGAADSQAPAITNFATTPAGGAAVGAPVQVTATVTDNVGVASVSLYDGATKLGDLTGNGSNYSMTWTPTAPATYSLHVKASDAANNVGSSQASSFTVSGMPWKSPTRFPFGEVTNNFGGNPGKLQFFMYVPADLPPNAPVVVALHGCTQTAQTYMSTSGWNTLADKYKFYVIYPQQRSKALTKPTDADKTGNPYKCFNWAGYYGYNFDRGQGENQSIIDMIDYVKNQPGYSVDPKRVFITGLSAGGGMAAAMLAFWPDVFAGGSVNSGPPVKCANIGSPGAQVEQNAYACMGITSSFGPRPPGAGEQCASGTACMANTVKKTPQEWGDLVRATGPQGFSGPWPRLMVWNGTSDELVDDANMDELVEQWTNVHGIDQTPDNSSNVLKPGNTKHTYKEYQKAGDPTPIVATVSLSGMRHGIAVDPQNKADDGGGGAGGYSWDMGIYSSYYAAKFWGITGGGTTPGAPVVNITAPSDKQLVQQTVTVTADVSDPSGTISSVAFFLDNAATPFATDNTAPFSVQWNSDPVSEGAHTLKVVATNAAGLSGTDTVNVFVRTQPATTCYTATNTEHAAAGRAHPGSGLTALYYYATGSEELLYFGSQTTSLNETSPGHFEKVASCP